MSAQNDGPDPHRARAVEGVDRLRSIYRGDSPFTSVYLAAPGDQPGNWPPGWRDLRVDLEQQGASPAALDAIDARLGLPRPEDMLGTAVISDRDGSAVVVDHAHEPPRHDFGMVDTLPYVAPLLEWQQQRVPHVVATVDGAGADIAVFRPELPGALETLIGEPDQMAEAIAAEVGSSSPRLLLVTGERDAARTLGASLAGRLPRTCRLVVDTDVDDVDELADVAVRYVSDAAARDTVALLREFRQSAGRGDAVDGVRDTIDEVGRGTADLLLIHDDPADQRRIWVGEEPDAIGHGRATATPVQARLVDALIRSAVLQGIAVHIIPTTGRTGPRDDTAAIRR